MGKGGYVLSLLILLMFGKGIEECWYGRMNGWFVFLVMILLRI